MPASVLILVVLQTAAIDPNATAPADPAAAVESDASSQDGSWGRIVAACLGVLAGGLLARKQLARWRNE